MMAGDLAQIGDPHSVPGASPIVVNPADPSLLPQLGQLPATHGVYAFILGSTTTHLSSCRNLQRRLQRMLAPQRDKAAYLLTHLQQRSLLVYCWPTGSGLESALCLYRIASSAFPHDYRKRLRLRIPSFVTLTDDTYPRLTTTHRQGSGQIPVFGPFISRESAVRYEEAVLSLFQIRRCTEILQPSADHPGCMYGEMNLCLRPCQLGVTVDEYQAEVNRVASFLNANQVEALNRLSSGRDRAAIELDFEYAAQLHRQHEKLAQVVTARPMLSAEISALHGLAVTHAPSADQFWIRPMLAGYWCKPVLFSLHDGAQPPTSLDSRLRQAVSHLVSAQREDGDRVEHLAILTRWFYSTSRTGEWLSVSRPGDYPLRKLSNAVSRLSKAESRF